MQRAVPAAPFVPENDENALALQSKASCRLFDGAEVWAAFSPLCAAYARALPLLFCWSSCC